MSNLPTRIAVALLLLLPSTALAQTDSHNVVTRIPNYIGLKIVDAAGDIALNAAVVLDYESDPEAYVAAVEGTGRLTPTDVVDFTDVQVAVRRGTWRIFVGAFPLTYAGDHSGAGVRLADIRVERGTVSGLTPTAITHRPGGSMSTAWNMTNSWQRIALDSGTTGGWRSLGFNGLDYVLTVQGDEDPGTYTTVVFYLLTNP